MKDHVKIIAILHIVFGILGAVVGVAMLTIFGNIAGIFGSGGPDAADKAFGSIMAIAPIIIGLSVGVLAVPSIIGGWGLLKYRPWARTLIIVLSVLDLFQAPIGTVLGVYGLVILNKEETRELFETDEVESRAPRFA